MQFRYTGADPVDLPTLGREGVEHGDIVDAPADGGLESHPWFVAVKPSKSAPVPTDAPASTEEVTA